MGNLGGCRLSGFLDPSSGDGPPAAPWPSLTPSTQSSHLGHCSHLAVTSCVVGNSDNIDPLIASVVGQTQGAAYIYAKLSRCYQCFAFLY